MEHITSFQISLDIDCCQYVYDYVNNKRLERPKEGWDLGVIARLTERRRDEPITKANLKGFSSLEKVHSDKGFLEKAFPKGNVAAGPSTFDTLNTDVLPDWVLPVFQPGDAIKGQVILDLQQPLTANGLNLEFHGGAHTKIIVRRGQSSRAAKGKEIYVNNNTWLWLKKGVHKTASVGLLPIATEDALRPGRHTFPFKFAMPSHAKPSVPPFKRGRDSAHLAYFLKATIDKGIPLRKGNIVLHQALWVNRPKDIAHNLQPVRVDQTLATGFMSCCFGGRKSITCRTSLPHSGFIKGDAVPLSLEIDNNSGHVIPEVTCSVEARCIFKARDCSRQRIKILQKDGVQLRTGPISPNMSPFFQLMLQTDGFPATFFSGGIDGMLVPPTPFSDCGIIYVDYRVKVEFKKKGACCKSRIYIPIMTGTHNSGQLGSTSNPYP